MTVLMDGGKFFMVVKMDPRCSNKNASVTYSLTMATADKDARLDYYVKQDEAGQYLADARKMESCKDNQNGTATCDVKLGYYANYEELGLASPWQTASGFFFPLYSWGVYDMRSSYT
mmetsp:Transcript_34743/g.42708  ORF Transcript_34743/g.42708 Transcript_34743/m.42708 type:complete len:117 (+) Transcript_34743:1178-1528(+)|eukprot:CAMPEP_0170452178 /NCGR_PEP_ID=MMETSP0123-20130129/1165_1 /TAXON_ID=182087 /ORGANISM="Favella ehrenbergii, Strain Fehren 1" /LENGTH=116 /DNA_ID=CAMNT_0010714101 /DNA_START=270 /DNA_END=620 /DNA_ORIENTATION=-